MSTSEKLTVSPSPHIYSRTDTATIMKRVLTALIPVQLWAIRIFGGRALLVTAVSVFSSVVFEWACRRILNRPQTAGDHSAAVTGAMIAMGLPVQVPLWMPVLASFAAIIIAKQLFGGLGRNFVNPAILGRAVLLFSFTDEMQSFIVTSRMSPVIIDAAGGSNALQSSTAVIGAAPLALFGNARPLPSNTEMFLGKVNGNMGEICALAIIIGGLYLCIRRVINPLTPLSFAAAMMLTALSMGFDPVFHLLAGGAAFAAVFMATDPVTSPATNLGKVIFGAGCGALTMFLRIYTSFADGVITAMLFMNIIVPYIDMITLPVYERRQRRRTEGY